MKILILLLITISTAKAQTFKVNILSFPGNEDNTYITNTGIYNGLNFYFKQAADTMKPAFIIENFAPADVLYFQSLKDTRRIKFGGAKEFQKGQKTKVGDFVFMKNSKGYLLWYWHTTAEMAKKLEP